jgi:hypothetical protein
MDADVELHGTTLHLRDVQIGPRALTAILDGRRVSFPKDRLIAQKVLVALKRAQGCATSTGARTPSSGVSRIAPSPLA